MNDELIKQELAYISGNADLASVIDVARLRNPEYARHLRPSAHVDFASEREGGRGGSYREAQEDIMVRATGIRQLLGLFSGRPRSDTRSAGTVLDVLGGDGLIARTARVLTGMERLPFILTSDASYGMVQAARSRGVSALWQPAEYLTLKDQSIEGVLLAYGTHHIAPGQRQLAATEAFRVLKPGGRIALHDFDTASAAADWFREVVNVYSLTKHPYMHFTVEEMRGLLENAGFRDVDVRPMYDPFVKRGRTATEVIDGLAGYIQKMYGLSGSAGVEGDDPVRMFVLGLAFRYFNFDFPALRLPADFGREQLTISHDGQEWQAELPRIALIATGIRP